VSKRLQVILKDPEYREVQRAARSRGLSIAEWVRQALARARQSEPSGDAARKLQAVRSAARLEYPTADIQDMLAEIELGYADREKR